MYSKGDYGGAELHLHRALSISEDALGPEHPLTAACLNSLARVLYNQDQYALSEPLYRRALAWDEKVHGPEHLETAASLSNLGHVLDGKGEFAAAAPLHRRAMEIRTRLLGAENRDATVAAYSLFSSLFRDNQRVEAYEVLRRHLLWLLERETETLHPDQRRIAEDLLYF